MAFSEARLVLLEDDIEHPIQAVFDAPVAAYGLRGALGAEACGRDVAAGFEAAAVLQLSARLDADDGGYAWQTPFPGKAPLAGKPADLARATKRSSMRPCALSISL
jgi:hypothetical protein